MKRYTLYMYAFALSAFALASCSKELTEGLDDVNIGVVTDENVMYDGMIVTAKKGQPVEFTINGEPDFVTFYSGELGHQYIYKDRTSVSAGRCSSISRDTSHPAPSGKHLYGKSLYAGAEQYPVQPRSGCRPCAGSRHSSSREKRTDTFQPRRSIDPDSKNARRRH